ncbi:hypothetical protein EIN_130870, partial [Entamoeba invadens IP1]
MAKDNSSELTTLFTNIQLHIISQNYRISDLLAENQNLKKQLDISQKKIEQSERLCEIAISQNKILRKNNIDTEIQNESTLKAKKMVEVENEKLKKLLEVERSKAELLESLKTWLEEKWNVVEGQIVKIKEQNITTPEKDGNQK